MITQQKCGLNDATSFLAEAEKENGSATEADTKKVE